jgi:hypothetical protein
MAWQDKGDTPFCVKTWLSSQAADLFDTGIQNLLPYTTNASVPAVTRLRSGLSMYILFVYIILFLVASFVNRSPEVTFRIALVQ